MPIPEVLRQYPELETAMSIIQFLGKPLLFAGLFLFVGLLFGVLVRRVTIVPTGGSGAGYEPDKPVARRMAIGDVVVWSTALIIASEAIGLTWFAGAIGPFLGLVRTVVSGVLWVLSLAVLALIGGFICTVAMGRGREIPLSLLGWWSLKHDPNKPAPEQEFDLGGGRMARVAGVSALHTTFRSAEGWTEVRPNWWLMEKHFGWVQPKDAKIAPTETPPPAAQPIDDTGPVPPPEPPSVWMSPGTG